VACMSLLDGRTASIVEESRSSGVDDAEDCRLGRGVPIGAARNTQSGQGQLIWKKCVVNVSRGAPMFQARRGPG
jgi:hypothetical protein